MKKVILIAFYFNRVNEIASKRLRALAKYLPQFDWEPIVIVPDLGAIPKENDNLIEPKKSFNNYSNHSNRSNRSNQSNRSNHSDYNGNDNDNNDYLVEHSLKDYVVNENEFRKESGKILAAMVYNFISFDTLFQEHIQVDEFSNVKMIQDEKFFEKLNSLHLDLTEKEMNDFKKTYRFEDNKSMLDVEKIKEDLKNVKIDDLPVDGLREEIEVEN